MAVAEPRSFRFSKGFGSTEWRLGGVGGACQAEGARRLFAADLRLDDRLPDVVLRLQVNPDETDHELEREFLGLSPEALVRARAYARGELPVDQVIAREPARRAAVVDVDDEEKAEATSESDTATADAAETGDSSKAAGNVERSHARQLIRYLQRTQEVDGPRRDLIYLESSGAAFGLPPDLADQLERAAVDGAAEDVEAVFTEMSEDDQQNALRLLARLLYEAIGIEAQNVALSLFRAIGQYDGDLTPVAAELLDALDKYTGDYSLGSGDLAGALVLALADDGNAAMRMREDVLGRDEVLEDEKLAALVLSHADALGGQTERIAEVFAATLGDERPEDAVNALAVVSDERIRQLLTTVVVDGDEQTAGLGSFVEATHAQGRVGVARTAFTRLVSIETDAAATAAKPLLPLFRPVSERTLAVALINAAGRRPVIESPMWLSSVEESVVPQFKDAKWLLGFTRRLWKQRFAPEAGDALTETDFQAVAAEIGRLRAPVADEPVDALNLLDGQAAVVSTSSVAAREEQYKALYQLVDAGALNRATAASSILSDLGASLAAPQPAQPGLAAPMADYVLRNAPRALAGAEEESVAAFSSAAEASSWLDATMLNVLRIHCALAKRRLFGADVEPPAATMLKELVAVQSEAADSALALWITEFDAEPTSIFESLEPRTQGGARLPPQLTQAITQTSTTWTPTQKADLLETVAPKFVSGELDETAIEAATLADADADRATTTLIGAYEAASNNDERRAVMKLWQHVNPSPQEARRKLVNRIYLPLLESGKGAAELALSYFALVRDAPTQAAQDRMKKAIAEAAAGNEPLAKRANRLMQDAGWIPKKAHWLKRTLRRVPRL